MNVVNGYPEYMRESIQLVEETREKRLHERHRLMSLEDRTKVLTRYHPDYKNEQKRPLEPYRSFCR